MFFPDCDTPVKEQLKVPETYSPWFPTDPQTSPTLPLAPHLAHRA